MIVDIFKPEHASKHEAQRRLKLLGDLATGGHSYDELHSRARATFVPTKIFKAWLQTYESKGLEGLKPLEWTELDETAQRIVLERYHQLGELADAEVITEEQIAVLADRNNWSLQTAQRWLRRCRVGGLWALAPENHPDKRRHPPTPKRALATLDEADLEEVYRRRDILGELANQPTATGAQVKARAQQMGVSPRTIRNYLRDYRQHGLAGLVPQERSDKGRCHALSERIVQIVEGIRLSHADWSVRAVYEAACQKAQLLSEVAPSEFQVRSICNSIPESVLLLADGREDEFRSRYRGCYRIRFDGTYIVYQIDHTRVDVLVKDIRAQRYRTRSGEIRPWLTTVIDSSSRIVMAGLFGYDRPDRFTVAAAIREALLVSDEKMFGGVPDEIWVDRGKELVSRHVQQLAIELGITLQPCAPHQPQIRGIGERFFGTLNTRLWSTLPGYVNSNVVGRNPNAKAELTLAELVDRFETFIDRYHNEVHSETGQTPLAYWRDNCFAEPANPRQLDMLLKEPEHRRVIKVGIKYENRVYWHSTLPALVGKDVLVRAEPHYAAPDEIEVFHRGKWICTAFATDSEVGHSVTPQEISAAQREQRTAIRRVITEARDALRDADREIEQQKGKPTDTAPTPPQPVRDKSPMAKPKKREPDLLDRLAGLDE
ncbi:MAG: DDE-type integrase/transposase/recombinase [Chloroflexi bacterium]|nr:DDE-type integrase/transposase/recombinase [Chloroflexota bacterium]MBU1750425.1 DDE-type integrase/transposase/recombinase [Chloroflexota bacterium]